MTANTVTVDNSTTPAGLTFSPQFNVAVPFVDRHLDEGRAGKIAIRVVDGGEVTYGELAENVNRCGNALLGLGLAPGDRVLMMVKDDPAFFYAFWGAIKAGILPVPLNTLLRAKDYTFIIEDSEAAGVLYSPEFAAEVEPALAAVKRKPKVAMPTEGGNDNLAAMIGAADAVLEPAAASADDPAFWLYSSGTTGGPKGVIHGHKDMVVASQHYGVGVLGVTEDDVTFSAAKLFFAYGLGNALYFPLWVGAQTVLFPGPPTPQGMFDTIAEYKPTIYYGVPTLYAAQLRVLADADPKPDVSSVRVSVSAGEPLPADLYRRWTEQTGIPLLDGIGTTEAAHIFISNRLDATKPGTSGKLVPGYEARIVDDDGTDVADGDTGNLIIKGGSVLSEYWNNPEKNKLSFMDGWFRTGDTYYKDDEGFYVCCGRSDDMLKVGGIWCSPVEIEAKLIEHPKVLEAAVVGRADDDDLIKPEAFVVLNEAGDASDDLAGELLEHCKSGLARYKYPRWFNFVDELPKTATGKIQRFKLRAG